MILTIVPPGGLKMPKGACAEKSTPCPVTIKCAKRAIILPFLCNKGRVVSSVIISKDLISKCVSAIMIAVYFIRFTARTAI